MASERADEDDKFEAALSIAALAQGYYPNPQNQLTTSVGVILPKPVLTSSMPKNAAETVLHAPLSSSLISQLHLNAFAVASSLPNVINATISNRDQNSAVSLSQFLSNNDRSSGANGKDDQRNNATVLDGINDKVGSVQLCTLPMQTVPNISGAPMVYMVPVGLRFDSPFLQQSCQRRIEPQPQWQLFNHHEWQLRDERQQLSATDGGEKLHMQKGANETSSTHLIGTVTATTSTTSNAAICTLTRSLETGSNLAKSNLISVSVNSSSNLPKAMHSDPVPSVTPSLTSVITLPSRFGSNSTLANYCGKGLRSASGAETSSSKGLGALDSLRAFYVSPSSDSIAVSNGTGLFAARQLSLVNATAASTLCAVTATEKNLALPASVGRQTSNEQTSCNSVDSVTRVPSVVRSQGLLSGFAGGQAFIITPPRLSFDLQNLSQYMSPVTNSPKLSLKSPTSSVENSPAVKERNSSVSSIAEPVISPVRQELRMPSPSLNLRSPALIDSANLQKDTLSMSLGLSNSAMRILPVISDTSSVQCLATDSHQISATPDALTRAGIEESNRRLPAKKRKIFNMDPISPVAAVSMNSLSDALAGQVVSTEPESAKSYTVLQTLTLPVATGARDIGSLVSASDTRMALTTSYLHPQIVETSRADIGRIPVTEPVLIRSSAPMEVRLSNGVSAVSETEHKRTFKASAESDLQISVREKGIRKPRGTRLNNNQVIRKELNRPETSKKDAPTSLPSNSLHGRDIPHTSSLENNRQKPSPSATTRSSNPAQVEHEHPALQRDDDGDIPLHVAVVQEAVDIVEKLVAIMMQLQADVDVFNNLRQTPLHLAVVTGNVDIIIRLLEAGASPNLADRNGQNSVHLAVIHESAECLTELLTRSRCPVDINASNYEGLTPLHLAVKQNSLKMATILAKNASLDRDKADGKSGQTGLYMAAELNRLDIAEMLLSNSASLAVTSYSGLSPYQAAAARSHSDMIRLFTKFGGGGGSASIAGNSSPMSDDVPSPPAMTTPPAKKMRPTKQGMKSKVKSKLQTDSDISKPN